MTRAPRPDPTPEQTGEPTMTTPRRPRGRALRAAALAATATFALAACGGSSGGSEGGDDRLSVVYVPGLTGNPFYNTVGCGGAAKARRLRRSSTGPAPAGPWGRASCRPSRWPS